MKKQVFYNEKRLTKLRHDASFRLMLTTRYGRSECLVNNVSFDGICIRVANPALFAVHSIVTLEASQIGRLTGIVRWIRGDMYGVQIAVSTNSNAKLASYIRTHFHVEPDSIRLRSR
nr:PilZ domain-containing protein [uncultured Gellertiella sp.]